MTRLSRWVGVLEVVDGPFYDDSPLFFPSDDPFTLRFHVRADLWLPLGKTVPIHDDTMWNHLSFTKKLAKNSVAWTGKVRGSLGRLDDVDGARIEHVLRQQTDGGVLFPVKDDEFRRLIDHRVRRADRDVSVTVPDDAEQSLPSPPAGATEARESIRVQALLAEIGTRMGMQIWIPKSDRGAVRAEWRGEDKAILDRLPLNYDDTTLRTIEQIDVLWLKGRSIRRAFEVEHTTSIYSGILRMADLLALQPNMDIRLHIVAPSVRREKVFQEIRRPVFSLLDRGPLAESCSLITYDSVRELDALPHLGHMSDSVLADYEEAADD